MPPTGERLLKARAEHRDMSLGDLIEGIVLHAHSSAFKNRLQDRISDPNVQLVAKLNH
jgi:hypothetical protein